MPRPLSGSSALMRPLVALALPGMYLVYKYNQYKRQQQEQTRRKAAERELLQLNHKIDKLLNNLDDHEPEMATSQEEECVICVAAKATMQTFPCGHRVVCRKCFVKTIQVAVSQRLLPLRCVVCRAKILRLRQARDSPFPTSISQYSMASVSSSTRGLPNSSSLYSFNSGSSGISGLSNVSSVSSNSEGSYRSVGRGKVARLQHSSYNNVKRIPPGKKVSSKSGARSKELVKSGVPQIRIDEYHDPPFRPVFTRPPRMHLRENKVAPQGSDWLCPLQETMGRLPTIKEYTEFISEKEYEKEKSSSTRIRCAQKLVSQIEHQHHQNPGSSPRSSRASPVPSSNTSSSTSTLVEDVAPETSSKSSLKASRPCRSPSVSPSAASSSTRSTPDKKYCGAKGRRESASSTASLKSNASLVSSSSIRSNISSYSNTSYKSAASVKSVNSTKSVVSTKSNKSSVSNKTSISNKSAVSNKSSVSNRSVISTKSSGSVKSNITVKSAKNSANMKKESEGKGVRRKDTIDKNDGKEGKKCKQSKSEGKLKALKKKFEGKEYHRLN